MKVKRSLKAPPKLNLIPILDAVFIFIFFLLMSAQFLEIYEISSDAPSVKTIDDKKDKRPPLNLTLIISKEQITVKTGLNENTVKVIRKKGDDYAYGELNQTLAKIKAKNIDEGSIIFRPQSNVPYKKIVLLMDVVRDVQKEGLIIKAKNKKGQMIETRKLFDQIIFETVI